MDVKQELKDETEQLDQIYLRQVTHNENIYLLSRDFALGRITYQQFTENLQDITTE
jgi:hypothetical protein